MDLKLKYSVDSLLDHEFKGSKVGYDAYEVDEFFDGIISDYVTFQKFIQQANFDINSLTKENKELKEQIRELEISNARFNERFKSIGENQDASLQNLDLLRKISILESALYKLGQDPNKIYKTDLDNR